MALDPITATANAVEATAGAVAATADLANNVVSQIDIEGITERRVHNKLCTETEKFNINKKIVEFIPELSDIYYQIMNDVWDNTKKGSKLKKELLQSIEDLRRICSMSTDNTGKNTRKTIRNKINIITKIISECTSTQEAVSPNLLKQLSQMTTSLIVANSSADEEVMKMRKELYEQQAKKKYESDTAAIKQPIFNAVLAEQPQQLENSKSSPITDRASEVIDNTNIHKNKSKLKRSPTDRFKDTKNKLDSAVNSEKFDKALDLFSGISDIAGNSNLKNISNKAVRKRENIRNSYNNFSTRAEKFINTTNKNNNTVSELEVLNNVIDEPNNSTNDQLEDSKLTPIKAIEF